MSFNCINNCISKLPWMVIVWFKGVKLPFAIVCCSLMDARYTGISEFLFNDDLIRQKGCDTSSVSAQFPLKSEGRAHIKLHCAFKMGLLNSNSR